jgi:hypothetical protein
MTTTRDSRHLREAVFPSDRAEPNTPYIDYVMATGNKALIKKEITKIGNRGTKLAQQLAVSETEAAEAPKKRRFANIAKRIGNTVTSAVTDTIERVKPSRLMSKRAAGVILAVCAFTGAGVAALNSGSPSTEGPTATTFAITTPEAKPADIASLVNGMKIGQDASNVTVDHDAAFMTAIGHPGVGHDSDMGQTIITDFGRYEDQRMQIGTSQGDKAANQYDQFITSL